jgi:hypothetical protein
VSALLDLSNVLSAVEVLLLAAEVALHVRPSLRARFTN